MKKIIKFIQVISIIIPVVSVSSLWVPVIFTYKGIPQINIFRNVGHIPELPDNRTIALLKSVNADPNASITMASSYEIVAAAERLLLGTIDFGAMGIGSESLGNAPIFRQPFDESLVYKGNSSWQLAYSSFLVPSVFLRAFDATGKEIFLIAARDFILGWWNFERSSFLPKGFLWNDHAVASRAVVLSEFWLRYRQHRIFDTRFAEGLIALAKHTARLLSRKNLYTYWTNHGFMQNVGLAKLSLSLRELSGMEEYVSLSFKRMMEQIDYFFDVDGVVLEHSPGYHIFGMELLNDMTALMKAAQIPVPKSVTTIRKKSQKFLSEIMRPDGTLPRVGDTRTQEANVRYPNGIAGPVSDKADHNKNGNSAIAVFGSSGFAIHRNSARHPSLKAAHLTVFWGYLPHMGHKHADELSLNYWAGGTDWWTSVGYWPYTRGDRRRAICWDGSNAPHLVNETCGTRDRTARALSVAHSDVGFALDLLRKGPDGFRVRRQIVSLTDGVKLIFDSFDDEQERRARIIWVSDPSNRVATPGTKIHRLESAKSIHGLAVQFLSSNGTAVQPEVGDRGSTRGWVVDRGIRRATAFVVDLPSKNSWSLNVSVLEANKKVRLAGDVKMVYWRGSETWEIEVPLQEGRLTVRRAGSQILIQNDALRTTDKLKMKEFLASDQMDRTAFKAYKKADAHYGSRFNPFVKYRIRMTWLLTILALVHFVYLLGFFRLRNRFKLYGLAMPIIGWSALMTWLFTVYFAT